MPVFIPDIASALREFAEWPRSWRRAAMYGVALLPLCIGVGFIVLAIVR